MATSFVQQSCAWDEGGEGGSYRGMTSGLVARDIAMGGEQQNRDNQIGESVIFGSPITLLLCSRKLLAND